MIPAAVVWIGDDTNHVECKVLSASIKHGRDDPASQPIASSATLEILGPLPAEAVIGARVSVLAGSGSLGVRFAGEITDLGVGWDSVDIARPRVIAMGDLARTGRRIVGDVPWPAELDGERVNRILTLAGFAPDPLSTDPGTVQLLARDVDRQPAQGLAQEAATDGGGLVWQDRAGRILYADAEHRRGAAVAAEFEACDVGLGLGWSQTLEGLANEAHVRYGIAPDGGEQPEVVASEDASIAARGTYAVSMTTRIATVADAQRRADEIVSRAAEPAWILGGLELDLGLLDPAQLNAVLTAIDVHSLVSITGLPAGSPATSALLWVEGWTETIEGTEAGAGIAWHVSYATSDYCRTAAAPRWDDLEPTRTWDTVDPAMTWNRASCIPPQPSTGRWNDVPASLRWDLIGDPPTWDTWNDYFG
jgi:hypothetical protein